MALSDGAANGVIDAILNGTAYGGGTHYASLHTADPGVTGANEATGGSYARQAVSGGGSAASRQETNASTLIFPAPAATTYTHVGIWNHATLTAAANFVWGGPLASSIAGDGTNSISISADAMTVKL